LVKYFEHNRIHLVKLINHINIIKWMLADKVLERLSKRIELKHLQPINVDEEKAKFMKSNSYNPQFVYEPVKLPFRKLNNLKFGYRPIDIIMKTKAKEIKAQFLMRKFLGTSKFTRFSKRVYGFPSDELVKKAQTFTDDVPSKIRDDIKGKITSAQVKKIFEREVSYFAPKWEVEEANIIAKAMVNPATKRVYIKANETFSKNQVDRLIAHEIYGHVLRSVCGSLQPYKMFSIGLAKYEATEEGLAMYKEKKIGGLSKRVLKGYAGRVLAVHYALNSSFRETYKKLFKNYSKEKSWQMTLRAKRGLGDTSKKGAFTKDHIYLKGYLDVGSFIKNASSLHLLHYGKISIGQIDIIMKIPSLRDPSKIFLKLHSDSYYFNKTYR
jgi:uncharacterized protein (TIGR02421 family)